MEKRSYNLFIQDSLFDPSDPKAALGKTATYKKYPGPDSKVLYKVWVFLDGRDMPFVQSVQYHLHPSFRNTQYQIDKSHSNPNFALVIWTWGIFNVKAEVTLISGEILVLNHLLTYANNFDSDEDVIQWKAMPSGSLQAS